MGKDVYRFLALYAIILLGYSGGFFALLRGHRGYQTIFDSVMTVFFMMFASFDYEAFSTLYRIQWLVAHVLLVSYLIIVGVVLLNILIAMMSTTYADVWAAAEVEKRLAQAKYVLRIEKTLTPVRRKQIFEALLPPDTKAAARGRHPESHHPNALARAIDHVLFWDKHLEGSVEQALAWLEDGIHLKRNRFSGLARTQEQSQAKLRDEVAQLTEMALQLQSTVDELSHMLA
ncbi:hypothetical protein ATCC90586_001494 [Pythium insidiosum]|nr:hypothetical protein ATCC90586_001494 [Pythium insidiosum]